MERTTKLDIPQSQSQRAWASKLAMVVLQAIPRTVGPLISKHYEKPPRSVLEAEALQ